MSLPPSARGARSCDPEPSELHEPGPRVKTCSSSCLSWLHPLRSWSLRQTRGGSLWRLEQFRLEAADAKTDQRRFHAIDDPSAFTDQAFALAAWAPGVFFLKRWDRESFAVTGLTTQPSQEHTDEHFGVETIRLCPAMLA